MEGITVILIGINLGFLSGISWIVYKKVHIILKQVQALDETFASTYSSHQRIAYSLERIEESLTKVDSSTIPLEVTQQNEIPRKPYVQTLLRAKKGINPLEDWMIKNGVSRSKFAKDLKISNSFFRRILIGESFASQTLVYNIQMLTKNEVDVSKMLHPNPMRPQHGKHKKINIIRE